MNPRHFLLVVSLGLAAGLCATGASAQQLFRIGTGGLSGSYYPIGQLIATAVTQPGRLVVSAQASNGSVANVTAVAGGALESGFSQSDIAAWAQQGTGLYQGRAGAPTLRLIANLYPEAVHLIARRGAGVRTVADLRGKRVGMDEAGSGTLVHARLILAAWNIKETELRPEYIKAGPAIERMKAGEIDALFFVGGVPSAAVSELATSAPGIDLVPIDGAAAQGLRMASRYFSAATIGADAYPGVAGVQTLAVSAQWVTREDVDADTVYQLTRALFSEPARRALAAGHPRGRLITAENAVRNAAIPFHPGAERYYREAGLIRP
jgi:TRAP transporter TAXI family solute receptor